MFISNHIAEKIEQLEEKYNEAGEAYIDTANIDNLKKGYIHKTIKLNRNYVHYNENQLYMFTFKSMDEEEVKKCFEVDLSRYKYNFDVCFVNCFDRLYVCDFVKKQILYSISIDTKSLRSIKRKP